MEKYHIGFYTTDGKDKIKGYWKLSEEEVQAEADSYLFSVKLGYTLTDKASIPKATVEAMAIEHGISIGDVLSCV